jgi:hypothetical protein
MALTFDHLFVMCDSGAPEADFLTGIGLMEGPSNVHPGQGTACRRFFFPRQYLELVWVANSEEARSEASARTRLWDRWSARHQGGCPFGLIFIADAEAATLPFATWSYAPAYLPAGMAIQIAVDTPLHEPEFFVLPAGLGGRGAGQPPQPAVPGTAVTALRLATPAGRLSSAAARWAESTRDSTLYSSGWVQRTRPAQESNPLRS